MQQLVDLPPVLSLQLLRFEVDNGNKKKMQDIITIPEMYCIFLILFLSLV